MPSIDVKFYCLFSHSWFTWLVSLSSNQQDSGYNFQAEFAKISRSEAYVCCASTNPGERDSRSLYLTQGNCRVLYNCWQGILISFIFISFCFIAGVSNGSVCIDLCCRCYSTFSKCTSCEDDPYKGWIQDWDSLRQAWQCSGWLTFYFRVMFIDHYYFILSV